MIPDWRCNLRNDPAYREGSPGIKLFGDQRERVCMGRDCSNMFISQNDPSRRMERTSSRYSESSHEYAGIIVAPDEFAFIDANAERDVERREVYSRSLHSILPGMHSGVRFITEMTRVLHAPESFLTSKAIQTKRLINHDVDVCCVVTASRLLSECCRLGPTCKTTVGHPAHPKCEQDEGERDFGSGRATHQDLHVFIGNRPIENIGVRKQTSLLRCLGNRDETVLDGPSDQHLRWRLR